MYPFLWKEDAISDLKQVNRDYMEKNNFFASEGTLFIDSKFFVLSLYICIKLWHPYCFGK